MARKVHSFRISEKTSYLIQEIQRLNEENENVKLSKAQIIDFAISDLYKKVLRSASLKKLKE